jgi:hypothetical protein
MGTEGLSDDRIAKLELLLEQLGEEKNINKKWEIKLFLCLEMIRFYI